MTSCFALLCAHGRLVGRSVAVSAALVWRQASHSAADPSTLHARNNNNVTSFVLIICWRWKLVLSEFLACGDGDSDGVCWCGVRFVSPTKRLN